MGNTHLNVNSIESQSLHWPLPTSIACIGNSLALIWFLPFLYSPSFTATFEIRDFRVENIKLVHSQGPHFRFFYCMLAFIYFCLLWVLFVPFTVSPWRYIFPFWVHGSEKRTFDNHLIARVLICIWWIAFLSTWSLFGLESILSPTWLAEWPGSDFRSVFRFD